ncbi:MAG: UDP-N-acetylmuramoyl-L-alanyl-D-glutamate--2,6-diaminopimelate ligase [Pseudomonadota bacterium]
MLLSDLIKEIEVKELHGPSKIDVRSLAYDASQAGPGSCFVAIKGTRSDGHDFALHAVHAGATVVVSEKPILLKDGVTNVLVEDSRRALGIMSSHMFCDPSRDMKLVGVTGTNGKTTTTYLIESIFKAAGLNPGVIGTVEYRYNSTVLPAPHTTPQSLDLHKLLAQMQSAGCDSCAMEVSSHALSQQRVAGTSFDAAVFTNLTPEHLDYHDDMDHYFEAKAILFEKLLSEGGKSEACAIINIDDPYGRDLMKRCKVPIYSFGMERTADVTCQDLTFDTSGICMNVATPAGSFPCRTKLCGRFNAQNVLAAVAASLSMGFDLESIKNGVERVNVVPGRFEPVSNKKGVLALVDYSHTPDALEKALTHAKELLENSSGRLIAVFGCGGDRDRKKRPLMGKVAATTADIVIVTSDNPRTEDPESIIHEILPGIIKNMKPLLDRKGYEIIIDRREAIAYAASIAQEGDVLVVAGKGHEDYQILGTKKVHFDDREVLSELLASNASNARKVSNV